jgi:hypothetical protein
VYIFILNCLVVAVSVLVLYEFFYQMSVCLVKINVLHYFRIVVGEFGALIAYAI